MPQVTEMVRDLSPLARLDEMHPTLAKFSISAGGERQDLSTGNGDGGRVGLSKAAGLSLSRAFETIEARKDELQVWGVPCGVLVLIGILFFARE